MSTDGYQDDYEVPMKDSIESWATDTPFKKSWDEWIDSDEGQRCASLTTLRQSTFPDILENRLHAAFCAGHGAETEAALRVERERLIDWFERAVKGHGAYELEPVIEAMRKEQKP